jgi:signal transduction histidine kinase
MNAARRQDELIRLTSVGEPDVFTIRQRGREIARAIGMDGRDQTRVAVVLSDIGRDLVRRSREFMVTFALRPDPPAALVIDFEWRGEEARTTLAAGWEAAERLMDDVRASHDAGRSTVTVVKHYPGTSAALTREGVAELRHELNTHGVTSPLDELRAQNQELLDTLENLESKRAELARLNAELEETNRGVVALYKELSEELEETNRGVVALYAELNEKSTQLKAASEAKTRFWSNISHELRAPVNSVVGLARMLTAPGSDRLTEEQRRQVDLISASGATLLALVNELLDTAKAESGRLVPQLAPVDLSAVFLQLRGTVRSTVPSPEVTLVIEDPPPLPPVWTDETMLVRILRNLLSNGLKFTERGEVRLTVEPDDENHRARFTVSDTGIGIPPDQTDKVFEEFHQVRNKLQARAQGTGLGLPYARRLSEILGGDLTLRSELGRGTTVVLRLPYRDPGDSGFPAIGSALVVDDEPGFRDRIAGLVGEFADRVVHASDGRGALDEIGRDRPDLVLLDLHMPGMNGIEVLTVLRDKPDLYDIPVVVVTSAAPDGLDLSSAGLGAALLLKSYLSADTVRLAITEAFAVLPRTVPR